MNTESNHKILILGAGFAGLAASKALESFGEVTVISPNATFEFFPNIHELVSGFKSLDDVRLDIRKILEARGQAFVQEKAVELDRENRIVTTSAGTQYEYDGLIVAIGGVNNDWGVPGVKEYSFPFKTASDCHAIGEELEDLEILDFPFSVTVVGGGVEGVEALGEILRRYNRSANLSVNLVEGAQQLLPRMTGQINKKILDICEKFPVSFHFGERVTQVEENQVILSSGNSIQSDLTIWTGGVKSHPQLEAWGLAEPKAWPQVNRHLQSEDDQDIFVIGDSVDVMGDGEKQAYLALEMGKIAGHNVKAILEGGRLKTYKQKSLPSVYSFGNLTSFIVYKDFALSGLPIAGLKEAIYQLNMAMIQDIGARPGPVIDTLGRSVSGVLSLMEVFLKSPTPFFSRFFVKFSLPNIFGSNRKE